MRPRLFAGIFVALPAAIGCYLSHAEPPDASPDGPDAAGEADREIRDEASARDDAGPVDDGGTLLCPGDDIVGASELTARSGEFDGRVVRVRGTVVEAEGRSCTLTPCAPERPCCNVCAVGVRLVGSDGNGPLLHGSGAAEPGCFGDECHLVCAPYDVGRVYVLRGTFAARDPGGPGLYVAGGPGDVCEESPPPDHRGAYRVTAKSSRLEGDCERWAPAVGGTGYVFLSVGDPGQVQMWQALVRPPGEGRFEGTITSVGLRTEVRAAIHWSCCDHVFTGWLPDSRAIEVRLDIVETGYPECRGSIELVGMREDVPCVESYGPEACFAAGGLYAYLGPESGELCVCPTFDGRKTCANDADCEGACLAEMVSGGCDGVVTGLCTKGRLWSGCFCWLEHGPTDHGTCWD